MPRRPSFTLLCQQAATLTRPTRSDLHAHTTASDGEYTPSQLVAQAWNAGLAAVAVTDHDTTAGVAAAVEATRQFTRKPIAVVAGVEVTTIHNGRGFHLLGLFVDPVHVGLQERLREAQCGRRRRFFRLAERLPLDAGTVERAAAVPASVGRRHLAELLVAGRHVPTRGEAFRCYLGPLGQEIPADYAVPFDEAVRLIADAGGVSSLAHPPPDLTRDDLAALAGVGLMAVEADFPAAGYGRGQELRNWASALGLQVTAGSDCHGPGPSARPLGSVGVSGDEFDRLRRLAKPSPG